MKSPIDKVKWMDRDKLRANDFNPNRVAPPELRLLKISILENGWTQPIVIRPDGEIVDGFHRWTVSDDADIRKIWKGKVPTVILEFASGESDHMMATIRHNRARGTHGVLDMAKIVQRMIKDEKLSMEEISFRLQMEVEEVTRLALQVGIPKTDIIRDAEFSKAWTV